MLVLLVTELDGVIMVFADLFDVVVDGVKLLRVFILRLDCMNQVR